MDTGRFTLPSIQDMFQPGAFAKDKQQHIIPWIHVDPSVLHESRSCHPWSDTHMRKTTKLSNDAVISPAASSAQAPKDQPPSSPFELPLHVEPITPVSQGNPSNRFSHMRSLSDYSLSYAASTSTQAQSRKNVWPKEAHIHQDNQPRPHHRRTASASSKDKRFGSQRSPSTVLSMSNLSSTMVDNTCPTDFMQPRGPATQSSHRYQCTQCPKSFSRPSSLRIHIFSHTGEKPHVCSHPGCGRRFSVQSNMRRHLRVHYYSPQISPSPQLSPPSFAENGQPEPKTAPDPLLALPSFNTPIHSLYPALYTR